VILLLYVVSAISAASWGTEAFELRRFLIRSSYLIALSAIVILWLVSNQRPPDRAAGLLGDDPDPGALLRYAAARFGARRGLFVWTETEEPWVYVAALDGDRLAEEKVQPGSFEPATAPPAGDGPFLFDQGKGRMLFRRGGRVRRLRDQPEPVHRELTARHGARQGLRIPVRSAAMSGDLFVFDVPGLCSDDLAIAEETAERLAAVLEHRDRFQATEEAAAMRAGLALARDLHDSVVQFLAGMTFRLEGLKKVAAGGRDVSAEIDALQQELVREQRDLRRLIADLRSGGGGGGREARVDLSASLRKMAARTAAQWDVACRVAADDTPLLVPRSLERHVGQLVREAVANAVRHGGAGRIDARLGAAEGTLLLEIADNGSGFPVAGDFADEELEARRIGPSSLRERVHNLGGSLRLHSSAQGASLKIMLPLED
jgi:signal transduction histidine kinase